MSRVMLLCVLSILMSCSSRSYIPPTAVVEIPAAPKKSHLDLIQESGEIRIGTTGDYAPFSSYNAETGEYEGIDIDMANHLAQSLGVKVTFVKTSWSSMMTDFKSRKFDMVMGGVSVDLNRQKEAFYSMAYYQGGKAAISKCDDKNKYESLSAIDKPGVRVIVNPGGSNETFVREHIKQATIILHDNNTTVFDQIENGAADVMITDAIETVVWHKRRDGLCAINPKTPFNFSEMAYLIPKDDMTFKLWVDQWLRQRIQSGDVQSTFDQWVR